jgi:hypothetical protein
MEEIWENSGEAWQREKVWESGNQEDWGYVNMGE